MGGLDKGHEKQEAPSKTGDNQHLTKSPKESYADHVVQKAKGTTDNVAVVVPKVEIVHDLSKAHSDAPKSGATLEDGPNGVKRVKEVKYDDGKSRSFTYDKEGHLTKYKDKNGHEWEKDSKDPNKWNQQDGKSSMRGQFIVGKAGEFQFANYDKKHVSHYDANGNEKKEGQREFSTLSAQEKAELRMHGNAFAKTGEVQDVTPPAPADPMKMSVAERDQHYRNQAMNMVDGAGRAIEGVINQGIDSLPVPKEVKDVLKFREQMEAGAVGEAVHTLVGLASLVSPHRPENAIVQQAENATEATMNQVFGPVSPTDYAGRALRETIIRGVGMVATPVGTAGDLAHAVIDPLATAGSYYAKLPNVGADIGQALGYLKDPRTIGQTAFQAVMLAGPVKFAGAGIAGKITSRAAMGEAGSVAGLIEDGASAFRKPPPGGAGDAFDTLRDLRRAKEGPIVEGKVVDDAAVAAAEKKASKAAGHDTATDVEVVE